MKQAGLRGAWLNRAGVAYPAPFTAPDVIAGDVPARADRLVG